MPRYLYVCDDCERKAVKKLGHPLGIEELVAEAVFETSHAMRPKPAELKEALICPRCGGGNATKTLIGSNVTCFIHGDGYLDRAGCHRDMLIHTLVTDDPYKGMRQAGEADDLKHRLERGNRHDPKPRHYLTS